MTLPDLATLKAYINDPSYSDEQLVDALNAEAASQFAVTGRFANTDDLSQALMRRVARNLALRSLPLSVQQSEMGGTYIGGRDPEVRRLEAPYRKLVVG